MSEDPPPPVECEGCGAVTYHRPGCREVSREKPFTPQDLEDAGNAARDAELWAEEHAGWRA